jgi:propanol-preferring alcohol dehydrogenase
LRDIPGFPYALLWGKRMLRSVANLTRADGEAFFRVAQQVDIKISPIAFALRDANHALASLREGCFDGAAVLLP